MTDGEMIAADAQLALLWLSQNGIFTVVLDARERGSVPDGGYLPSGFNRSPPLHVRAQIDRFNRLASRWHAERGYIERGDPPRGRLPAIDSEALQIFAEAWTAMMNAEEWVAFARLVAYFRRFYRSAARIAVGRPVDCTQPK